MQRSIIRNVCNAHARLYSTKTHDKRLIYITPNAPLVKLAKVFSLSTLGVCRTNSGGTLWDVTFLLTILGQISSASAPAILYFWESPAIQASGISLDLFFGALLASICSTGAIHYVLSPFISSIQLHASSSSPIITPNSIVTLETRDLLAKKRYTTVAIKDLEPANGLLQTWKVNRHVLLNQYALEQRRGTTPSIRQTRFWLDRRGAGDQQAMVSMMRLIQSNQQKQRIV